MVRYYIVIVGMLALNLIWAERAAGYADRLPRAKAWRFLVGSFAAVQLFVVSLLFGARPFIKQLDLSLPVWFMSITYVWHVIVLPAVVGWIVLVGLIARWRGRGAPEPVAEASSTIPAVEDESRPTRRQMLVSAAAIAAPPLATGGLVALGYHQRYAFRIRELTVASPQLPPNLDGLRIAHLSDTHIGAFTNTRVLNAVAEATNALKADLICFTGDLLDFSLHELDGGFDFLHKLDPRHGFAMCVGNHDLFQSGVEFRRRVLEKRFPLLLNAKKDIAIGSDVVQLLGLDWGTLSSEGPHNLEQHMARLMPQVDRDGKFPILLAHHPHALDLAAQARVPLVLSGHTHGGQMNLTDHIGGGPLMFKYWSGLYRRQNTSVVVSNGIGSWFPLRVHAPAEVIHITLRREV